MREVAREVRKAKKLLVLTHIRPDGDAVGSAVALVSLLRAAGRDARAVLADAMPRQYAFLEGASRIVPPRKVKPSFARGALAVVLDTSNPERLGDARALFDAAARTASIDHHPSNSRFADADWLDPSAAAVGEMVRRLAGELGWGLTPAARDGLYVAIMTDTGRFTYSNTTASTLELAAELVRAGARPDVLAERVYGGKPAAEWELEARARASLKVERGGRIASIALTMRDFRETRTTPTAVGELASLPRLLEGVDLALFFYEIDRGRRTKVGLRSARGVDSNALAARFGGGGHALASGCTVDGPLEEVRPLVIAEAKRFLKGGGGGQG
ncbi:MAG: DHH family phosphoesterase [Planctomycetota bacterium]|jgi:phosphoesterase RecJ-like protein